MLVTASQIHLAQDKPGSKYQEWDSDPRNLLLESLFPHLQGGGGREVMKVDGFGSYLGRKLRNLRGLNVGGEQAKGERKETG